MVRCKTYVKGKTYKKALQLQSIYQIKVYQTLGAIMVFLSILIFVFTRINGHDNAFINAYIISFGLIGILFLFYPKSVVYKGMRQLKSSPFYGKEINWEISDNVSASAEGFNSTTKLEMYYQVIFTKYGILLYPEKGLFHWLPREGFQDEESFMQAKALIASKIDKSKLKFLGKGAGKSEMQKDKSAAK